LTDKMTMNDGNTVCLAGELQAALVAAGNALQEMVCECAEEVKPGPDDTCRSLGTARHSCVNRKIHRHNSEKRTPRLGQEQGYERGTGNPVSTPRGPIIGEPFHQHMRRIRGNMWPDGAVLDDFGRPVQFAEFKFQCDQGVPTRKGAKASQGTTPQAWSPGQLEKTQDLGRQLDPPVTEEPALITSEACS
jgi:hypothetical protein